MKRNIIAFVLMLAAVAATGWNVAAATADEVVVNGSVVDKNGAAVGFATVVVTDANGELKAGVSSDENGLFYFQVLPGKYNMAVSLIGYKEATRELTVGETHLALPPTVLEEDAEVLGAATVQAVMPKTKLTGEGLQTSVRGTVLEDAGNARDVLARTPGMIQGQNGLEVIGKGSPVVYINGRKVTDSSELDRLQSNEIQNVEVISNPGAQYDAQVRSVVRIRTIRKQGEGFGFTLDVSDEQSLRKASANDPNLNFNANYRINSVDIFAGVNVFRWSSRQTSTITGENLLSPKFTEEADLGNDYMQKSVNYNGGLNWQIADNHSVGFKVTYGKEFDMLSEQFMNENVYKEGVLYDKLQTNGTSTSGDVKPQTTTANVYYNGTVGKLNIDLNLDYYGSRSSSLSHTVEKSIIQDAVVDSDNSVRNNMYAGKLVLSYPIWTGQLQIGTEDVFTVRNDKYSITGASIPSADTHVDEKNIAAFANYAFYVPEVGQFSAGVRYEHVNYSYESISVAGKENIDRKYDNLFPSVSYAGMIGPVQTMFSYSVKTSRPDFSSLSSAIRYNNKYTLQSGNASLQPSFVTNLSATAVWKFLTFMLNYDKTKDAIITWSERYVDPQGVVSDGVVIVTPKNLDTPIRMLQAVVNASPTVGIWTLSMTGAIQQQWLTIDYKDKQDPSLDRLLSFNDKPLFILQMFNTFRVKNGWQFELGAEYHSKGYTQNMEIINHYLNVNAAVQKTLLKDGSLVIRLSGSDLAGLGNHHVHADFGAHLMTQTNIMDEQRVKLTLRYKFNTANNKYKGSGAGADVKSRIQ